jgi:cyclopropane-fatty-acyl-phospholipid synthase
MNDTLTVNDSLPGLSIPPKPGLFQRLVLEALSRMTEGCLRLHLPCGAQRVLGTAGHAHTATLRILRADFFKKVVLFGDVGFGESYVDGDWETDSVERVISWAILNIENAPGLTGSLRRFSALNLLRGLNRIGHLLRPNSVSTARRNIAEHYDLGNDFYSLWLDPTMTYSAAKFTSPADSLESAQTSKYDALCKHLRLNEGDHLLEIGTGWGGMAVHAARTYGCRVTTVTISEQQHAYATERVRREGLAGLVDVRLQDFRHITGRFDKIVSIEMMEALGERYIDTYCSKLQELAKPAALIALQYITVPDARYDELRRGIDFIQKHIFPGSLLMSVGRVATAMQRAGTFTLHQLDDLGLDYARTLRLWCENFHERLEAIRGQGFCEGFVRKWRYYLQYCEAAFAMRNISVVHALYSRPNNPALRAR